MPEPVSVHDKNLKSTCPVASCFPGPHDAPHWEMNFVHGHGFLLLSNDIKADMQKSHISAHPFSPCIVSWSWDKMVVAVWQYTRYW